MIIFVIIASISLLGIGAVIWILNSEKKLTEEFVEKITPEELLKNTQPEPSQTPINISKKLKSKKNNQGPPASTPLKSILNIIDKIREKFPVCKKKLGLDNASEEKPLAHLHDSLIVQENLANKKNVTEDSLPVTPLSESIETEEIDEQALEIQQEESVEKELESSLQLAELKEKYGRLDNLFKEKSSKLEKAQAALDNELKNGKDFNKVKDIIEKEVKEVKNRVKDAQNELHSVKEEKKSSEQKIVQLENKIKELEDSLAKAQEEENIKPIAKPSNFVSTEIQSESVQEKVRPEPKEGLQSSTPMPPLVEKKDPIPIIDDKQSQEFQPEKKDIVEE